MKIVGKGEKFKRGSVSFMSKAGVVKIHVEANDPVALLVSVTSAIKQLKIVSSIDSLMD